MFEDAEGKTFGSTASLILFDIDIGYDTEDYADRVVNRLQQLERNPEFVAQEINVGAGADWPVIAVEFLEKVVPVGAAIAAFFLGEKVERNAAAWTRTLERVASAVRKGFGNRNVAALRVMDRLARTNGFQECKLIGYRCFDRFRDFDFNEAYVQLAAEKMRSISDVGHENYSHLSSPPIHALRLVADGKELIAIIEGLEIVYFEQAESE